MFLALYHFFRSRRALLFAIFFITLGIAGYFTSRIKFAEDISSLLPDSKALKTLNEVASHTKAGEQLIFLVSFRDSTISDGDSLIAATTTFTDKLKQQYRSYIDTITTQPAGGGMEAALSEIFNTHLPLFLAAADYQKIDSLTQPAGIANTLQSSRAILMSPASVVYKNLVAQDPVGISRIAYSKLSRLQWDTTYSIYEGWLFSKEGRQLTFFLKPKYSSGQTGTNATFFKNLEHFIADWQKANPSLHITYFGGPAVAAGNAAQLRQDTIVTLSATIILLIVLTFYYFRKKRTPFILLVPVIYGALTGLAVMYLIQGSVSVIALGAGAIVLGIAIDYSVHFLSHLRHASIEETVKDLQQPLTIGSFTTVAAFLSLRLVHTPILRDLGLFAAASLVGAALCTLIFLPHFPLGKRDENPRPTFFDALGRWKPEHNKWLLWGIVLLTPVFAYFSFGVQFDDDLMHLNYLSPQMQKAQQEVSEANSAALSAVFVIGQGGTEDIALHNLQSATPAIDSLISKGLVRSSSNPASLIPDVNTERERISRWEDYWQGDKRSQVVAAIQNAASGAGFSANAFSDYGERLKAPSTGLSAEERQTLKNLFPGGFAENESHAHFAIASLRVVPQNRAAVLAALSHLQGVVVTDRQQGAAQMVHVLSNDFNSIAIISTLIVFFTLLISYGRIELAVISFLPMAISWVWILGIMALLGLKFNIVNIIISTLIFGLGDDYSIFTMDGLIERYKFGGGKLTSVRTAVYVSVATVLIGLGVLLLAKHPALRSIAAISVTGMICVLLVSQTLQPALFNWLIQKRADKGLQPFTFWSLLKSAFAFLYFVVCSIIVTILGVIFTRLWPFGKERGKYLYHSCIRFANWSLLYIMANVRKRHYNRQVTDFSKPAIYIANHSSFLDLLVMTSLNPKVVLLTNKWVYRSPVFGAVVRMAEYYPVADGAEESLAPLRDLVSRGYSIALFPEGTRSFTDKIGRFHKGAFYLSKQLGLDIVPIVFHGVGNTMQKGDWLLKNGTIAAYYHPRVDQEDPRFGVTMMEQAKRWRQWYNVQLENIKEQVETPVYFRERLIRSYTYKGPVLEWYCRIKTSLEKNYETVHRLLPREGLIYDLGCGYGFAAYLLHWSAPDRKFIGIDYDEEKIDVAQHNYLRTDSLTFTAANLNDIDIQSCAGIIIQDVLHYLLPDQQEALLLKCAGALQSSGVLLIRDGVVELQERQKGTAMTEVFSTRLLKFNKTANELHFLSGEWVRDFASSNGFTVEIVDETRHTSNLLFVLTKAAGNA